MTLTMHDIKYLPTYGAWFAVGIVTWQHYQGRVTRLPWAATVVVCCALIWRQEAPAAAIAVALTAIAIVTLKGSHRATSANYLFVDLDIAPGTQPGELAMTVAGRTLHYPLLARMPGSAERQGFGPKDAIYLVVPDRFAKGGSGNRAT